MGELLQSPDEQVVTVYGENEVMHQVLTLAIEVTELSPNRRSLCFSRKWSSVCRHRTRCP